MKQFYIFVTIVSFWEFLSLVETLNTDTQKAKGLKKNELL